MRTNEAYAYMRTRLQKVCDALGNGDRLRWNNQDAAAVRALLKARSFVYATEEERIQARRLTWKLSKRRAYARRKAEAAADLSTNSTGLSTGPKLKKQERPLS